MKSITFLRKELYEKVWKVPMNKLSLEYGINVYQLTKVCIELNIPRPESGYWSKLRHGLKVTKHPLPESETKQFVLNLGGLKVDSLNKDLPRGYKSIVVKDHLRNPHTLIAKTQEYIHNNENIRWITDDYGRIRVNEQGLLRLLVTKKNLKRAFRIYDAILKECIRQGFETIPLVKYGNTENCISDEGNKAFIFIQEEGKQIKHKIDKPKFSWQEYEYERYTTDKLKLLISGDFYSSTRKSINDTSKAKIEDRIDEFLPTVLTIFNESKQQKIKEAELEKINELKRIERERIEREKTIEISKREELEELSSLFTKSQYVYDFITEVNLRSKELELNDKQKTNIKIWSSWAMEHAERLDPVKHTLKQLIKVE